METRRDVVLNSMAKPGREALSKILQASQDRIYGICYQILGHPQDAEDAAQEVLLKIPGVLQSLRDDLHYRRWLYRVSINAALELKRKKQRRLRHEGSAPTAECRSQEEPKEALHRALAALEDDDRDLLVAHYFEKRTLDELARDHACSTTALWKRLARGKERLKEKLQSTAPTIAFSIFERLLESIAPSKAPADLASRVASNTGRIAGPLRSLFVLGGAAVFLAVVTAVGSSLRSPVQEIGDPSRSRRPDAAGRVGPAAADAASGRVEGSTAAPVVEPAKGAASAKVSLSERLVRFRAWLKEHAARSVQLEALRDNALDRLFAGLNERTKEESLELLALIVAEPETFLAFVKEPENEECLLQLLALLCPMELGTRKVQFGSIRPADLPASLLEGLAALLEKGSSGQRDAVLLFSRSFSEFPDVFRASCLSLLSGDDAGGQAAALELLTSRDIALPLDRFAQVRRISEETTDFEVRADCVAAMIFMNSKEVDSYLFGNLLKFHRMPFTPAIARAIRAKASSLKPENEGAYSVMVGVALSGKISEPVFETLAECCLYFQPARAQTLLQQAAKTAPSPALAQAIGQVLEDLGQGETSSASLRETFKRTLDAQRQPRSP